MNTAILSTIVSEIEIDQSEQITLYICRGFSGMIVRAVVERSRTIAELIPDIADQIEYSSPDWEKIGLYNLTRDFEFDLDKRLDETPTKSGDLIIMADGAGCHKTE